MEVMNDDNVRAYMMCKGDIVECSLSEFLKLENINVYMSKFKVTGYYSRHDYWYVKLFGKYRIIRKPFVRIKTVKLEYIGEQ